MFIIADAAPLGTPLPARIRHVLDLRRHLIDFAAFIVVEAGDSLADIEDAAGFPIADDAPPWEWVLDHGGVYEAPIILNDDGATVALIVPDENGVDSQLLAVVREHAETALPIGTDRTTTGAPLTPRA